MSRRPWVDFAKPECQPFLLEGSDHAVLLIHGFTGSIAHLRQLGDRLHQQGYTVRGFNLPGHATQMEDMGKCTWQNWLQAAKEEFVALKDKYAKVSVAGLSMGGVLTLLLAEQMDVTAAIPISAPMAVQNKLMPFARYAAPFVPTIWWHGRPKDGPVKPDNPYDLGYPGFPTKSAAELNVLIGMARRNLHAVTCPLLVVQSHTDKTIAPESADTILAGVSSDKKGVLWLENAPHVCTITGDVDRIAAAVGKVLQAAV